MRSRATECIRATFPRKPQPKPQILQQELSHLGLVRPGGLLPAKVPGAKNAHDALRMIENRIRREPIEYAFAVSDDGTLMLAKAGDISRVTFTGTERERLLGTTLTHNHPNNGMLSGNDVHTLVRAGLKSVRAVTEREIFEIRQPATAKTFKPNRELADKVRNEYQSTVKK